jgi:hypothetical protein
MPRRTHRGRPDTIPCNIHKEVGYHPTRRHVKLLSLGIPYVPHVSVHFKCLFIRTQPTRALIDTGRGYHLGALNIISGHSSSLPSSILHFPLIAPARSPIMSFYQLTKVGNVTNMVNSLEQGVLAIFLRLDSLELILVKFS